MTKIIAMYLPQYHETEDNNKWWGKGFTDWVSVKNSEKLFDGHRQPREPLDDRYYTLIGSEEFDSCFTALANHSFYWFANTPINYRPGILPRSQDMLPVIEETTGLYGISKDSLVRYRCRIGRKPYMHFVSKFEAVDINTEEDLKVAEHIGKVIFGYGSNEVSET